MAEVFSTSTRAWACAAALAASVFASPPASAQRTVEEIMSAAVRAREAGDLYKVVRLLRQAYKMQPAPEILNNLGKILEQMGRYREAVEAYQRVADDPTADPQLRSLDTSRIAALQPRLNKAWVLPLVKPSDALIYMDGALIDLPPGVEFPASHRQHLLLVVHPAGKEAAVRLVKFPVDQRSTFTLEMDAPHEGDGTLEIPPAARLRGLALDGRDLGPAVRKLRSVRLPAGSYALEITWASGALSTASVTVEAGKTARLPAATQTAAPSSTPPLPESTPGPAVDADLSATSSGSSTFGSMAPWAGVALGLGAAAVGGVLFVQALGDEADLEADLAQGDGNDWSRNGNDASLSGIPYDVAASREAQVGTDKTTAAVVMGVGGLLAVGSLAWKLMAGGDGVPAEEARGLDRFQAEILVSPWGFGLRGSF